MAHQASKKRGPLPPDHQRFGCCTSNGITPQKVPVCIRLARRFSLRLSELRIPIHLASFYQDPGCHLRSLGIPPCRGCLSLGHSEFDEAFFIIRSWINHVTRLQ